MLSTAPHRHVIYTPCNDDHAHCAMTYHQHGTSKPALTLPLNLVVDRMSDLCPFDQTILKQLNTQEIKQ